MSSTGPGQGPGPSKEKPGPSRLARRATSPALADRRGTGPLAVGSGAAPAHLSKGALSLTLAASRPLPPRERQKFVPLPDVPIEVAEEYEEAEPRISTDGLPTGPSSSGVTPHVQRGRITVMTVAESFNRKVLEATLQEQQAGCTVTALPEVMYVRTPNLAGEALGAPGEAFFFDYGVVCFWGLTEAQELEALSGLLKVKGVANVVEDEDERQVEEMLFVYSASVAPNIRNDTFTIDSRQAGDHQVKMAISHALAQSAKLAIYEERMMDLVEEVRHIPAEMAETGTISMRGAQIAQLMGKVFILKASVNLTATMLDTPEFFWRAPDQLQTLYERACTYLDIEGRLDMLNARFMVLQRMLDIWSDHSAHQNIARLDVIIVVLILIEVVMAGVEVFGWIIRARGWTWHGPKLWELLWMLFGGRRHHPADPSGAYLGPTAMMGEGLGGWGQAL